MNYTTDCLIIGSGAAGLTLALGIADKAKVIVLSKEGASAGSTNTVRAVLLAYTTSKMMMTVFRLISKIPA